MNSYLRSAVTMAICITLGIGFTSLKTRAAEEEKGGTILQRISDLEKKVKQLKKKNKKLTKKLKYTKVVKGELNGLAGPHVIFEGCNVHVRSGSGNTTDGTFDHVNQLPIPNTVPTGLGNLVVGYNEEPLASDTERGGSHNLIVGLRHNYTSVGGAVFGQENTVTGPIASVTGGNRNTVSGAYASVSAGFGNTASGYSSSVNGGLSNTASGFESSVSGGFSNTASGGTSSVSGGSSRSATGGSDWVAGALFQEN